MDLKKFLLFLIIPLLIITGCNNPSGSNKEPSSLSYNANGADSGTIPDGISSFAGDSVTVAANTGSLIKAGYPFFVGWNTKADGSGDFYRPGESLVMPEGDVTLYADWVGIHELSASNGSPSDTFGVSVDIEGDYAVVGAHNYENYGAAYVFHRTGTNSWDKGTQLDYTGNTNNFEAFGRSVSISGDYVLVGAKNKNNEAGAAYIYQRTGTNSWGNRQTITASDSTDSDNFGLCVSLDGDYAAIGTESAKAVYVYKKGSAGWSNPSETIIASESSIGRFGYSVSLDGDTLAIGAQEGDEGKVYVYTRTGENAWGNKAVISAPEPSSNGEFGGSVALDGDTLAVGDLSYDEGSNQDQGGAFVYMRSGGNSWGSPAKLTASDGAAGDNFGTVAISGDTILVGAENAALDGNSYRGAVYIYRKTGSNSWDFAKKLTDGNGAEYDRYFMPALDSRSLIIGAWGADSRRGSASIYLYK